MAEVVTQLLYFCFPCKKEGRKIVFIEASKLSINPMFEKYYYSSIKSRLLYGEIQCHRNGPLFSLFIVQ